MFTHCYNCFRPLKSCYCKYIVPVETRIKFIFLMHPKEAYRQKTGTGRLAHLSLPGSEILIGIDFTQNKRLVQLLNDDKYYPVLLYPDENAWTAQTAGFENVIGDKQLLVIVVDATWFLAKKMLRLSPNLHELPKISFRAGYKSQFEFKTQPAEDYLSSIESCYYLIKEFVDAKSPIENLDCNAQPLMDIFHRMIDFQLESEKLREAAGIPNRYRRSE